MIDIEKAEKEFTKYVKKYDMKNPMIKRKYYHSFRVSKLCRELAIALTLDNEQVDLATLIGLLHDIGRFEQVKIYNSFDDSKTIDHGGLGANILFDNNILRQFIDTDEYDEIIKRAVYIHNKLSVLESYSEIEKLYSKIVRDADKIDILYLYSLEEEHSCSQSEEISDEVVKDFINKKSIDRMKAKTEVDSMICYIAFLYDINFPYSYEILRRGSYIDKIFDSICLKEEVSQIVISSIKNLIAKDFNIIKE